MHSKSVMWRRRYMGENRRVLSERKMKDDNLFKYMVSSCISYRKNAGKKQWDWFNPDIDTKERVVRGIVLLLVNVAKKCTRDKQRWSGIVIRDDGERRLVIGTMVSRGWSLGRWWTGIGRWDDVDRGLVVETMLIMGRWWSGIGRWDDGDRGLVVRSLDVCTAIQLGFTRWWWVDQTFLLNSYN